MQAVNIYMFDELPEEVQCRIYEEEADSSRYTFEVFKELAVAHSYYYTIDGERVEI